MRQLTGEFIGDLIPLAIVIYAFWHMLGKAKFKNQEKQKSCNSFWENSKWRKPMLALSMVLILFFLFNIVNLICPINKWREEEIGQSQEIRKDSSNSHEESTTVINNRIGNDKGESALVATDTTFIFAQTIKLTTPKKYKLSFRDEKSAKTIIISENSDSSVFQISITKIMPDNSDFETFFNEIINSIKKAIENNPVNLQCEFSDHSKLTCKYKNCKIRDYQT